MTKQPIKAQDEAETAMLEKIVQITNIGRFRNYAASGDVSLRKLVADAETKVRQQIAEHRMGHQGESWLSQGSGYVKEDELHGYVKRTLRLVGGT